MASTTVPREGLLAPNFELPRSDGGSVRLRSYRGRRGLAVLFTHGAACAACRHYLAGGLETYAAYAEETAELLAVVPDCAEAAAALRHDLALPFPVLVDADGRAFTRYGLTLGGDAAVLVADRYGEPRLWRVADADHDLPPHSTLLAELRYLALSCSGGCSVPIWADAEETAAARS
jgi:peroxiredoxin